ncbi:MAG: hypothetical protein P1V81_18760 [Planctomycetota bacterium]|nr:hypothetical protein [Planctomycetota bacterium]
MRTLFLLPLLAGFAAADVTTFDGQVAPAFRGEPGARYDAYDVFTSAALTPNTADLGGSHLGSSLTQADPAAILTSTGNIYDFAGPSDFTLALHNTAELEQLSLQFQLTGTGIDPASVLLEYVDALGASQSLAPSAVVDLNLADPGETQYTWSALAGLGVSDASVRFGALGAHMSLDVVLVDALLGSPSLQADTTVASLAAGGVQHLTLDAGSSRAGDIYWVLTSASGTTPGLPLGDVTLPLNFDAFTTASLLGADGPLFQNTFAPLDAFGQGSASLSVPPGLSPSFAGLTLNAAFLTLDPITLAVEYASDTTSLTLLP